ncbi:Endothelial cell-specific molecule 1 [Branchiostoma belcheri]|nr:Endothelial cell-specific molecule 1 [Branchiostoma belcheri]
MSNNMRKNTVSLVVIDCLLALSNWTSGVVVNLSAKIPENAGIGEQVIRVVPTAQGAKEEVICEIIDGNIHGRFSVTRDCVIVVARPLDFGLNRRYNLTVAVPGTPETCYVDLQVEDVDGYPPIYNDTCELPVLGNDRATGQPVINGIMTGEYMEKGAGLFVLRTDLNQRLRGHQHSHDDKIDIYTGSDCHVTVVVGIDSNRVMRTVYGLTLSGLYFLRCFHPLDHVQVFEGAIILGDADFAHYVDRTSYVWTKRKFKLLISFIVKSTETQRLVCRLPHGRPVSMPISRGGVPDEVSVTRVELEIQPVGCPPNKYGLTCEQNCTCENGARCHGLNGACKCRPGWTGVVCDIPHSTVVIIATPSGSSQIYIKGSLTLHCRSFHLAVEKMVWTFPNETKKRLQGTQEDEIRIESIQSEHNGTYTCTVVTEDKTVVQASYELQAVACPPGKRGELCEDDCGCLQGAVCDRWAGCVCPPGWTGRTCEARCPDGTYGRGCSDECLCQNGGACDPSEGQCNCTDGWYGAHCTLPCPSGQYGWRCRHACGCKNNATCHNVDGSCACAAPWTGKWCDVIQTETSTSLLPLQVSIPLSLTLLGALAVLYKWWRATRMKEGLEEAQVLLELSSVEEDLTQGLQPGWLKRWERRAKDLTLGNLIGQGAFACVREGSFRTANADVTAVAVKSVRSENRLCYRAFCREAAMLVALSENCKEQNGHSNIIKLFGVITKSSPMCILLEYATKGDLLQLLKQQPRDDVARLLGRFLRYAVHISRALKELRSLRIAHGDVAARNVLVSGDDVAKLSDFGLAHDVYTTTAYVSADRRGVDELLPLKWMALESLERRKFTCESDTWSFGVLLWEIATGGEEPDYRQELIQQSCPNRGLVGILRKGYRLQKPPRCPDELYDVMTSCWQEKPSARPEPTELERRLTDCRQEMDPLFVIEKVSAL